MPHPEDYEQRKMRWIDAQANASAEVVEGLFNLVPDIRAEWKETQARGKARMEKHWVITVTLSALVALAILADKIQGTS